MRTTFQSVNRRDEFIGILPKLIKIEEIIVRRRDAFPFENHAANFTKERRVNGMEMGGAKSWDRAII